MNPIRVSQAALGIFATVTCPLAGQAKGWVLDSVIDRTTGEVVQQVVASGDKLGTFRPGTGILAVTCTRESLTVTLISVYIDMFTGSQGTVTLRTQLDDGPEVVEIWPLPDQIPMRAEVQGPAAWALARTLASHTKFSVAGAQSETFHIANNEILKAFLARCARAGSPARVPP